MKDGEKTFLLIFILCAALYCAYKAYQGMVQREVTVRSKLVDGRIDIWSSTTFHGTWALAVGTIYGCAAIGGLILGGYIWL